MLQVYSQEEGINYYETFASVKILEEIRLLVAFAAFKQFTLYQIDVKSAFMNANMKEEVYVKQSPGFESIEFLDYVYKLCKALNRLKISPKDMV